MLTLIFNPKVDARIIGVVISFALGLIFPASVAAQRENSTLEIRTNFADKTTVSTKANLELMLNRPLTPGEGSLAVFIGETDVTRLFSLTEQRLSYAPFGPPLRPCSTTLVVYLVSPQDDWREVARFDLHVKESEGAAADTQPDASASTTPVTNSSSEARRFGFDKFELTPSLTVSLKWQSALLFFPDSNRPDRINFTDIAIQGNVRSVMKRGNFASESQFDIAGVSYEREALRFGERGTAAPQVDLSSYLINFQIGPVKFQAGHVSFGSNRHLISGFSSRGLTLSVPIKKRVDFTVGLANGTSVVGWNNFLGVNRRKHQVLNATVGVEFLKERPGGLRLEVTALHGSLLPLSNFNQGLVNDAERNVGGGVRLIASDKDQRFRVEGGYVRSRFFNPADPLLSRGLELVAVQPVSRNARYLESSYQFLKGVKLFANKTATLTFGYKHERVDPLFRSVAAYSQADKQQNQFELSAEIANVTVAANYTRFNDNLAGIRSILQLETRQENLTIGAPLLSVFGDPQKPSPWWPRLSFGYSRTHQFAAFAPINADFTSASHVPDQLSTIETFSSDWERGKFRWGYRFNRSFQDNRQTGRQNADLKNLVHGGSFGISSWRTVDLNFDLNRESAFNNENGRIDRNWRVGSGINWRTTKNSVLAVNFSTTFAGDVAHVSRNRGAEFDAQWSQRFTWNEKEHWHRVQGQFFIRYAQRYAFALDNLFGFRNLTKLQTTNAGLSFTFF